MSKKIKHFIYTPFLGTGDFNPDNKWLLYRIRIFKTFTQRSILSQRSKEPIRIHQLVSFRPEDENNSALTGFCSDILFTPVFTGLLYYDDRFSDKSEKNRRLVDRLSLLKQLESECADAEWIYWTKLDSDDMLSKTAVEEIQSQEPGERKVFIYQNGYIYNRETGEMAEWNPNTCPPFYTICFPRDVFFNPQKHLDYMKGWKSHEDTTKIFNPVYMSDRKYCVLVHGKNTTTTWNHRFKGKSVDSKLLSEFI